MAGSIRTGGLFLFMILLFMGIGMLVGSYFGSDPFLAAGIFFAISLFINIFMYFKSGDLVLKAYKVRLVDESQEPRLYHVVEQLATQAGLPMPKVGIIPDGSPNAFATGRNPEHAVVCATQGLMSILDDRELAGVMAHELAHVKNRDILIQTLAAAVAGAIMMLVRVAYWGSLFSGGGGRDRGEGLVTLIVLIFVAPIAAMIVQMAISRAREYKADATGAAIVHDPEGLARALEKLTFASARRPLGRDSKNTAHMFIVNPLRGGGVSRLFSTHPPMEQRIARLRDMRF